MDKDTFEKMLTPVLGFAAVLASMAAFLLCLYLITIAIRAVFALG